MRHNVDGHFARESSSWRRMATATWKAGNDPTIYGMLDIDATAALEYIGSLSNESHHVTMTHLVTKAIADTLALHPECNGYVCRGRVFLRDQIDVFVLVAVPSPVGGDIRADLSGLKIEQADRKSVVQIADEVAARTQEIRHGQDRSLATTKRMLDALPWWLLKPALNLATFAQYELNLDLTPIGIPRDTFGSAFVTSVGTLGIGHAFAPLVPMTRLSVNVALGQVEERAVVEDGKVVARPVVPLTATFDHRVIDGYQAGRLGETFRDIMRRPAARLGAPTP